MEAIAAAIALGKIREKGLTAEADILEAAIDEALCDQPIVRIAGGMTADQIAEKVVAKLLEHTQVVGAKLVQKPLPNGVPPVPWRMDDGDIVSDDDWVVVTGRDLPFYGDGLDEQSTLQAIVAAMNGYYSPQTPAESAAANSETGIPDTAGYPNVNGN